MTTNENKSAEWREVFLVGVLVVACIGLLGRSLDSSSAKAAGEALLRRRFKHPRRRAMRLPKRPGQAIKLRCHESWAARQKPC